MAHASRVPIHFSLHRTGMAAMHICTTRRFHGDRPWCLVTGACRYCGHGFDSLRVARTFRLSLVSSLDQPNNATVRASQSPFFAVCHITMFNAWTLLVHGCAVNAMVQVQRPTLSEAQL